MDIKISEVSFIWTSVYFYPYFAGAVVDLRLAATKGQY